MIFSCIIPARDVEDPKLKALLTSIRNQDFPQEQIETIVVTEGDSEQAKAIGIRQSKGSICAMFCADNYITNKSLFAFVLKVFNSYKYTGVYSKFYHYEKSDNSLNRYFSLIGNNDPIAFYLGKADRRPWYENDPDELVTSMDFKGRLPSLGDNGFFYRREAIIGSDLFHYYPMDNAVDLQAAGESSYLRYNCAMIWHRTSENLIPFLIKRYKYARDLYSDRNDRRWKMLDTGEDYWKLAGFILATLSIVGTLSLSIRGFLKVRDWAWFWHPIVCFGFLITYTILAVRNCLRQLSSRPWDVLSAFRNALSPCGAKRIKISKS